MIVINITVFYVIVSLRGQSVNCIVDCAMLDVFLQLGVLLLCGLFYRHLPGAIEPAEVRRIIGSIVLNVFIPLLTFGVLCNVSLGEHLYTIPTVSIAAVVLGYALSWLVYARFMSTRLAAPSKGALILAGTWCNAMYLGLPITTAVLGDGARHIPIEYDYLGMTPLLFTLGTIVCVEYGTTRARATFVDGLREVVKLPPTLAIAAALLVNVLNIPVAPWMVNACTTAGKVVAPLMLFSIGLTLRRPTIRHLPSILPAVFIRTIIVPMILWSATRWFIDDHIVEKAAILETSMPTMMLTMVFAQRYGLDEEILAQAILASTFVSAVTLPFISQWL